MTFPRAFRSVGRVVNPAIVPIARRIRPLAVVDHVGRRSGAHYATPVMGFPAEDGWVVALPYGADVQWLRNTERAGGATLTQAGTRHPVQAVRRLPARDGAPLLPRWARPMMRTVRVRDYALITAGRTE